MKLHLKPIYKYIIAFILGVVIAFFVGKSCQPIAKKININSDSLKAKIPVLNSERKKAKDTVIYRDSIRTKYVIMWKEVRHDSLIPCQDKLLVADTLFTRDSSLISALREVIKVDSLLIRTHENIHSVDSAQLVQAHKTTQDTVNYYRRQVRRQKAQKWAILGLWGVREGSSLLNR